MDSDPRAAIRPRSRPGSFRQEPIEAISFPDGSFDVVLSSAVLHFAADDAQFRAMLTRMWRVLKPGGLFFCRLASSIGIEHQIRPLNGRRRLLPDGSERYLVDETFPYAPHLRAGRPPARSAENHRGPKSARHDHLGPPKTLSVSVSFSSRFLS